MKKKLEYNECHYKLKNGRSDWKKLSDKNYDVSYEEDNFFKYIKFVI